LRESDPLGLKSRHDAFEASAKEKDHKAAEALFQHLKVYAANYQAGSNAKSYRTREKLIAMLPPSAAGWTLLQMETLQKRMKDPAVVDAITPLSIDATEAEMRAASPEQLADLIRRQQAAKTRK